jgi:ribosomal protein L37E
MPQNASTPITAGGEQSLLVDCGGCGNQISMQASTCPKCGHPNRRSGRSHSWAPYVAGVVSFLVVSILITANLRDRKERTSWVGKGGLEQSNEAGKAAIAALKRLEARTEVGISYKDYVVALGEANFPVKQYLESEYAKSSLHLNWRSQYGKPSFGIKPPMSCGPMTSNISFSIAHELTIPS